MSILYLPQYFCLIWKLYRLCPPVFRRMLSDKSGIKGIVRQHTTAVVSSFYRIPFSTKWEFTLWWVFCFWRLVGTYVFLILYHDMIIYLVTQSFWPASTSLYQCAWPSDESSVWPFSNMPIDKDLWMQVESSVWVNILFYHDTRLEIHPSYFTCYYNSSDFTFYGVLSSSCTIASLPIMPVLAF